MHALCSGGVNLNLTMIFQSKLGDNFTFENDKFTRPVESQPTEKAGVWSVHYNCPVCPSVILSVCFRLAKIGHNSTTVHYSLMKLHRWVHLIANVYLKQE